MYSEIVILAMLHQGPRHGYEIKKDVERALGGMVPLNNKTLYLTLKRFEEMGAVTRQVIPQEGKPNRHLYQLTDRGIELLHAQLRDFEPEQAGADAEFFTRVSFFDLLEACLKYLQKLQHLADTQDCPDASGLSMSSAQRVLAFHIRRVRDEYQWIATWLEEMQASS